MGERKVLNKYFPPDFDPSAIPRGRKPKNAQIEVRMMLPMSIRCNTCGEYMYRGKKFNSKKEVAVGEDYHGILIFRFYIKCVTCSAQITFKTDPKSGDYVAEMGCSRNFEPWRQNEEAQETAIKKREDEELMDSMKSLENRTLDSKIEMDILDALDEIKAINQRHERVDTDALLDMPRIQKQEDMKRQEEEDDRLAKDLFAKARKEQAIKRVGSDSGSDEDETDPAKKETPSQANGTALLTNGSSQPPRAKEPEVKVSVIVKRKVPKVTKDQTEQKNGAKKAKTATTSARPAAAAKPVAVPSLLVGYGGSSGSESS